MFSILTILSFSFVNYIIAWIQVECKNTCKSVWCVENTGKSPVKRHDSNVKKRVQFEYKPLVEYKVYAISRGYEQRNDMNAHVIV